MTRRKAPGQVGADRGDGRPTPIIFSGVDDGHDYHSGGQLSFPNITDRHRQRRYAGEPARVCGVVEIISDHVLFIPPSSGVYMGGVR